MRRAPSRFNIAHILDLQRFVLRVGFLLLVLQHAPVALAQTTLSPTSLGFGNQVVNQVSTARTVTFKNTQTSAVTINSIAISGTNAGDFAWSGNCPLSPQTLAAGKSCSITVTFKPSALGNRSATLTVTHSATTSPQHVTLTGTGIAPVTLSTTTLNFGSIAVGNTSSTRSASLTNHLSVALLFSQISATGDYKIVSNTCNSSVAAGASCSIGIQFSPVTTGTRTGVLTFVDNSPNSPQTVALTGTGSSPVTASPTSLSFPSTTIGNTTTPKTVTFTNHLNKSLAFSPATISGDFAISSNTCGSSVGAGLTCTIGVTFSPTVTGTRTGTLTIPFGAFGSPLSVWLSGTGNTSGLKSLSLSPVTPSIALGLTQPFVATGTFTSGKTANLTSSAAWTSSLVGVATVSASGLATSVGQGTTTIKAAIGSINSSTVLTVTAPALVSIAVSPQNASIALGTTQQFAATGTYTNGSTRDLSSTVTWNSSAPSTAKINGSGLASSAAVGLTTVTATSGSISGLANLSVTPAVLVSIVVTPLNPTVAKGLSQQFTATGTYTNGAAQDLSGTAIWKSANPAIAGIAPGGNATGLSTGSSIISATDPGTGISGQSTLTVGAAQLVSIALTPGKASIALGTSQQLTAIGTYTDGSTLDVTTAATWSSSAPAVATVNASGLAASQMMGATTITATVGPIPGSTTLTVTQAALVSIAITPAIPSIPNGETQQFMATGTFTDRSIQDITATANWSSSVSGVATIGMSSPNIGLAQATGVGSTTIAASASGVSGSTSLTVLPAVVISISVVPSSPSLAKGTTTSLAATATYSDNTTRDVTNTATWSSTDSTIAAVDSSGTVTAVQVGSATITANFGGSIPGIASVQVTPAILTLMTVTPSNASIPLGTTQQFSVMGTFSDGSMQDETSSAQWSSSDASIATVSMDQGTIGLATSTGVGAATITATVGTVSSTSNLTITPAVLVSIAVTPSTATIALGLGQQYTAIGKYTDGTTKDITTNVTWTTSSAMVAVISNTTGSNGLATSSGVGSTTVTATMGSVTSTANLTVGVPQLVSVAVTPASFSIAAGTMQQLVATGTYTDGSHEVLSNSAIWASSDSTIATVSASGSATGVGQGSATITATSGSIVGSAVVTVTAPVLTQLLVAPTNPSVPLGRTQQFTATAVYSDGSAPVVTASAQWTSSNTGIASVNASGLATAISQGNATIMATYGGQSASTVLMAAGPVLNSITLLPNSATVAAGSYMRFTATGFYSDGSSTNVGNQAVWSSSNTSVATVDSTGLARTSGTGTATITAALAGVQGTATLTVVGATGGGSARFVYAGNNSTISGFITDQASGGLSPVPNSPTATGGYYGAINIVADPTGRFVYEGSYYGIYAFRSDPVSGQLTPVTTSYPAYGYGYGFNNQSAYHYGLAVHPSGNFLYAALYNSGQVRAYLVDAGNGGLTPSATYTTGTNPSGVALDPTGKFLYAANAGSSTISAYLVDGASGALTAITGAPFTTISVPYSLAVDPSGKHLYVAGSGGLAGYTIDSTSGVLTAIGGSPFTTNCCFYLDSVAVDPTGRFLYAANDSSNTVNGYGIDQTGGGLTAITGSPYSAGSGTQHLAVDASGRFVYATSSSAVMALAIDQTSGALTQVTGSPFTGVSYPVGIITTGAVAASTSATLQSVTITPVNPVISTNVQGKTQQLVLLGNYSDGTTKSLTESAAWSSSITSVATVSSAPGTNGLATSVGYGTTTITASYGGQTATATLTVQSPALVSIAITPATPTIASGTAIQLHATGTYADSSTLDITNTVTWSSSDSTVATASNTSGSQGLTTGVAPGTVTITAALAGVQGTATLTVQ
jgi:uncharacterized protein YjdB